jgi:hypothetical protein
LKATARARRDNRLGPMGPHQSKKIVRIIGAVGNQIPKIQCSNQRRGLGDVVALSSGQEEAQRIALGINRDVDFDRKAAATTPQGLAALSTLGLWRTRCARTMVESSMTVPISGSSAK